RGHGEPRGRHLHLARHPGARTSPRLESHLAGNGAALGRDARAGFMIPFRSTRALLVAMKRATLLVLMTLAVLCMAPNRRKFDHIGNFNFVFSATGLTETTASL